MIDDELGKIIKMTRHGYGGEWCWDACANIGPINLFKVIRAKSSAQRGVGGYQTVIKVDGHVIDQMYLFDLTMVDAKAICKYPAEYVVKDYW